MGAPFDDIRHLTTQLPQPHIEAAARTRARCAERASGERLGRLDALAEWLSAWQGLSPPQIRAPLAALFAANLTPDPEGSTRAQVELTAAGGAAVNVLAREVNAGLKVFDLALDVPGPDIAHAPAMGERDCAATLAFGMEAVAGGNDLLLLSALGRGNAAGAAAVAAALLGGAAQDYAPAAGDAALAAAALELHRPDGPLEALRRMGGRAVAALAGAILAARIQRVPVLLDGLEAAAAALVLWRLAPGALDHAQAAHAGSPGEARIWQALGLRPLLDLQVSGAPGAGAALALALLRGAAAVPGLPTAAETQSAG